MKLCEGEQSTGGLKTSERGLTYRRDGRRKMADEGVEVDVPPRRRRKNNMTSEIHTVNCK